MSSEAFIGVLACARAADGAFPEAERTLLDLVCRNHAFTRTLDDATYRRVVIATKSRIDEVGWEAALEQYLSKIPSDWGYTTLLAVIDICLVDADEDDRELTCIGWVADRFGIPANETNAFMHWFRVKNGMLKSQPSALSA
jgi:hypothetical protein